MIARDSKSYPYLAIAQHYGVPYAEVLLLSDKLEFVICSFGVDWMDATLDAWTEERIRQNIVQRNIK